MVSRSDYYPFGLAMGGRTESSVYRYGFNGKEKDSPGMGGGGNTYDYGFRIYNPEIAKFLSVDPLAREFPWNSTYAFAEGSPISNIDLDGLEKYDYRMHHAKASGNSQLALATYVVDWFSDKLIGGPVRAIQGGFEYANNERQYKNRHDSPESVIPEEIASVNYRARQFESGAKVIKGFTDQLEFNSAMMGLAMGGLESAAASQFAKSTTTELTVYRVFGGDARAQGFSWTTVNPSSIKDFRNLAGLPSGGTSGAINTADFLIKGKVNINSIINSRSALPLDGNLGGLPELIIDPRNINFTDFKVLKP